LFRVEISALAPGTTTFTVRAGTAAELAHDFIVAPTGGGTPHTGGVYANASATLTVEPEPPVGPDLSAVNLRVERLNGGADGTRITFNPQPGFDHFVQFSDSLLPDSWQSLPGGPHNNGLVLDASAAGVPRRFYRVYFVASGSSPVPDPGSLGLAVTPQPGGTMLVGFTPQPGFTHSVEFSNTLAPGSWQPLPGAPHDSGTVLDHSAVGVPRRFYRVLQTSVP
jgi:hypothetical protein